MNWYLRRSLARSPDTRRIRPGRAPLVRLAGEFLDTRGQPRTGTQRRQFRLVAGEKNVENGLDAAFGEAIVEIVGWTGKTI